MERGRTRYPDAITWSAIGGFCTGSARETFTTPEGHMVAILVAVSLLIGVVGLLFMSQATTGVGLIAFACLVGITARIAQAARAPAAVPSSLAAVDRESRLRESGRAADA
jgi:hypothetical protein